MLPNEGHSSTQDAEINPEKAPVYQSREEYLEKLRQWLDEARLWHGFCAGFPYYVNLQNQTRGNSNLNWNPSLFSPPRQVASHVTNQNNVPGKKHSKKDTRFNPLFSISTRYLWICDTAFVEANGGRILGLCHPSFNKNGLNFYRYWKFLRSVSSKIYSTIHDLVIYKVFHN